MKLTRMAGHHLREIFDAQIVMLVFEVEQHRHVVLARDGGDPVDMRRIHVHREFLLSDADRSHLEVFLDDGPCFGNVGQFVGEKTVLLGILARDRHDRVVATGAGGESVFRSRGEQDRHGDSHVALVREQFGIAPSAVGGVLVDIDHGVRRLGQQGRSQPGHEIASREHARQNTKGGDSPLS